jgi:predicted  nucleic acid-binding Zn-ribbon protein
MSNPQASAIGIYSTGMTRAPRPWDPFQAIEEQLKAFRAEDDKLARSLEDTREARRRLAGKIRALEASLSLVRAGGQAQDAEMHSGTIADAIAALLKRNGEMRASELTAALQEAGKLLRTDSAYATLFKTLARDDRFSKVEGRRGYWRLA